MNGYIKLFVKIKKRNRKILRTKKRGIEVKLNNIEYTKGKKQTKKYKIPKKSINHQEAFGSWLS